MRHISKTAVLGLALGLLLPLAGLVRADEGTDGHDKKAGNHMMMMDPAKRLEKMTKKYNLTQEQQDKIKAIFDAKKQKMEESRKAMKDEHKATRDEIRAVLNPDQQKQFDEDEAKMESKMESRRKEWKEKHSKDAK